MRQNYALGTPMEKEIGYCRAVRVGNHVAVSGTAPIAADGGVATPGDCYGQTKRCLEIIAESLGKLGAGPQHVVRTRIMMTDIELWKEAAKAHGEMFGNVQPGTCFVQVSRFINPGWLVEIEADAIIDE